VVERDAEHGDIAKVNPVATWTEEQVMAYLAEREVPRHPLYDKGFRSIGCAPCTRAVEPHEDPRAGRWWWENADTRECGLHPRAKTGA